MVRKSVYLFAKTKGPLEDNIGLLDQIVSMHEAAEFAALSLAEWPELLTFSGRRYTWGDGFALSLRTVQTVSDLAVSIRLPLSQLRRWTLYRSETDYLEFPANGPLSESMFALRGQPIMFYYLLAKETDYSFISAVSEIISQMKHSVAYPVAEFNDGLILAVSTNDPFKIAINRSFKALLRFEDWVFMSAESVKAFGDRQPWVGMGSLEFDKLLLRMVRNAEANC